MDEKEKYGKISGVLIYIFFLNIAVALIKFLFGLLAGSISMIADSFHSFFDSTSNIVGLIAIRIASKPPDKDHPYGHNKYENFATIAIAVLIFFASFEILKGAGSRLLSGDYSTLHISAITFTAMVITVVINYLVSKYERKKGVELASPFLEADSMHTRTDIYVSLSVLFGFLMVKLGYPVFDPVVAVFIVVLIVKMGYGIIKQSSVVLCDTSTLDEAKIYAVVLSVDGVEDCHKIRTRGSENNIYLDLHIKVGPNVPIKKAHEISHKVVDETKKKFSGIKDVVVHTEPSPVEK
ncbi:MAG: cation transporter [Candidatus Altiarchaeales archaeon]|nr:cation transporter [Candidatus Altiarchaeales archaeon]